MKTFIIAEAGVNHNGSLENAFKLIDVAVEAGVDAVKFQTAIPELLVTKNAVKAEYQKQNGKSESQLEMLNKLQLSFEDFEKLYEYCKKKELMFLSTPFDSPSIKFLSGLGMTTFKIPSGEITNLPYLREIAGVAKKIILSTGMCSLDEVRTCISVLTSKGVDKKDLVILHCTSQYPTPYSAVNLEAMITLKDAFNIEIGYSDHTLGIEVATSAVALGASVVEKHFTLDTSMEGPDHSASLSPIELKQMVSSIRNIEAALGNSKKELQNIEKDVVLVARRSIVAATNIRKGEVFTEENLTTKRPGTGVSPMKWDDVIGTNATKDYVPDSFIELS